jgi:GNAT superfamily N-acetyltransferase
MDRLHSERKSALSLPKLVIDLPKGFGIGSSANRKRRTMAQTPSIEIEQLRLSHAHVLAPLVAAYAQALKRGAPRQPDQYYAEQLLQDRTAEFLGAFIDGALVGFVIFYDLPEPVSGLRAGQCDHIYVHHDHRGKGIAKALVDVLAEQAGSRGWSKLMLNAPKTPETARKVFESIGLPADWHSYVLRFER